MTDWHVAPELAQRYGAGHLDGPLAASMEAHVAACSLCQSTVAATVPGPRLETSWAQIVERLDAPSQSWLERALGLLGLSESDARLVRCASAPRPAWFLSLAVLLVFSVAAAQAPRIGPDLFLWLAPVLPVLAVGMAYGPWVDPAYEVTHAAPYSLVRLVLLRTGLALIATVVLAMLAGAFIPGSGTAGIWLLPAAALVAATLALSAWLPPLVATVLTTAGWLICVALIRAGGEVDVVFGPSGQLAAAVLLALSTLIVIAARRAQAYDLRRFL